MQIKTQLKFTALREAVSEVARSVVDNRQKRKVTVSIHDALLSGLACMYFQDPSLLQFQKRLEEAQHRNNLQTLFAVKVIPKETQLREIIDNVESECFRALFKTYYLRLQRENHLEAFQIFPNQYYFPMDGSQFFSSNAVCCEQCLVKEHKNGSKRYSHQILQGGIAHPDCSEIIPFMPEQIVNTDGSTKQDCEMNAAKRLLEKLHNDFPKLNLLLGGDALFSKQPIIEQALCYKMDFLFAAKPDDHRYMMEYLDAFPTLNRLDFFDKTGRAHRYEWMNELPLNGHKDSIFINFLRCTVFSSNKQGEETILYKNSWVTNVVLSADNINTLVRAGRCRWKNENECFNVMKNQGYCMEHSYGHGKKNRAFNFYLLTLIAFFMHQIFELVDGSYKACRKKLGSKKHLWETIRSYIKIIVFDTWDTLLSFVLAPTGYRLAPLGSSP